MQQMIDQSTDMPEDRISGEAMGGWCEALIPFRALSVYLELSCTLTAATVHNAQTLSRPPRSRSQLRFKYEGVACDCVQDSGL